MVSPETKKSIQITEATHAELITRDQTFNAGEILKLLERLNISFPAVDALGDSEGYLKAGLTQVEEIKKHYNYLEKLTELVSLLAVEKRRAHVDNLEGEILAYDNQLYFIAYLLFLASDIEEIHVFDFVTLLNPARRLDLLDTRDA